MTPEPKSKVNGLSKTRWISGDEGAGYLITMGTWVNVDEECMFINIYAPQQRDEKRKLWAEIKRFCSIFNGLIFVFGDFNAVRRVSERVGSQFIPSAANDFYSFIMDAGLVEVKQGGRRYTRISRDCTKLSKLDRALVLNNAISLWPSIRATVLPKRYSNHFPIFLKISKLDYGSIPFRFCNVWLKEGTLSLLITSVWNTQCSSSQRPYVQLKTRPTFRSFGFKRLSEDPSHELEKPFSSEEVKAAVWSCGSDKTPGPDGFSFNFIKRFWNVGDPLSPFLFIIAVEALNVALIEARSKGIFKALQVSPYNTLITHLQFTDDALFLEEWSELNVTNLIRILRCFNMTSGLKINLSKSKVLGVGVNPEEVSRLAQKNNYIEDKLPFTYLGLPFGSSMRNVKNWNPVIQKFHNRLSDWKAKNMSIGGRVTLIKSVLSHLPLYFFSLYKAQSTVLKLLESIRCSAGLGFGSLKAYNLALLAKWWWRVCVDRDSLWACVIDDIYGNLEGTKDLMYMPKFKGVWSNIAKVGRETNHLGIPLISSFQRWVGNGESISFREDCWLGSNCLAHMFSRLFELETNKRCKLIERCSISDGVMEWKWAWRRQIRSRREQKELYILLSIVWNTYLTTNDSDGWRWSMESSGVYSVKSFRAALDDKFSLHLRKQNGLPFSSASKPLFLPQPGLFGMQGTTKSFQASSIPLSCVLVRSKDTHFAGLQVVDIQQELSILRPHTMTHTIGLAKMTEDKSKHQLSTATGLTFLAAPSRSSEILLIKGLNPTDMQKRRAEGLCYSCH
ncbi:putative RNA-directed DNA polymerase [Tanacetum coccineum]